MPASTYSRQRPARLGRRPLVVQRDARALLPSQLPTLERDLPGERAQERRLPGAVRPGEREPVVALDLEGDAVEEDVAGELLAERDAIRTATAANYPQPPCGSSRSTSARLRCARSPTARTDAGARRRARRVRVARRRRPRRRMPGGARPCRRRRRTRALLLLALAPGARRARPAALAGTDVARRHRRPAGARSRGLPPPHRLLPPSVVLAREAGRPHAARYVSFADYLFLKLTGEFARASQRRAAPGSSTRTGWRGTTRRWTQSGSTPRGSRPSPTSRSRASGPLSAMAPARTSAPAASDPDARR